MKTSSFLLLVVIENGDFSIGFVSWMKIDVTEVDEDEEYIVFKTGILKLLLMSILRYLFELAEVG